MPFVRSPVRFGLLVIDINPAGEIREIRQVDDDVTPTHRSSLNWDAVQRLNHVTDVNLLKFGITGPIKISQLPESLVELSLSSNFMDGAVSFIGAPRGLVRVGLSNNRFTGPLDLLPLAECPNLEDIWVGYNQFSEFRNQDALKPTVFFCSMGN